MSQISTVQVPCYVIKFNNTLIINSEQVIGQVLQVPCRNDFQDDPDYWAVPVRDSGIFTTLSFLPKGPTFPNAPTFDSFTVFRVRDKLSGYTWWIYGGNADFTNACSTCCGVGAIPMPGTLVAPVIRISPCDTLCIQNANGSFYSITALPYLTTGVYFPYGSYNGVALPVASGSGYATPTLLLAFLNANWTNIGSPNATFVWTLSADNITLTATGGNLNDTLCITIATIGQSM